VIPDHPAFVHFPVALLCAAFLFELAALAFRRPALHDVGRANLYLGTLAALVAVGTGLWAEGLVDPRPPALDRLVGTHETLALVVASLAVVLSMWRVALRRRYAGARRGAFVLALGVLALLVLYTGHIGGRMVYDHGAAVTVGKRAIGAPELPAESGGPRRP